MGCYMQYIIIKDVTRSWVPLFLQNKYSSNALIQILNCIYSSEILEHPS